MTARLTTKQKQTLNEIQRQRSMGNRVTATVIALHTGVSTTTATQRLASLRLKGLVKHQNDGYSLTPQGLRLVVEGFQ
jgi:Mn-dependent DtxR family transcriptional regulator